VWKVWEVNESLEKSVQTAEESKELAVLIQNV